MEQGKFDHYDKKRDQAIYRFLLYCFALVTKNDGTANFSKTSEQFSKDGANFAQRIYNDINDIKQRYGAARLTTGKLAALIEGLRKGLEASISAENRDNQQFPKLLTLENILYAFQRLIELSPEEKEAIGLNHIAEEIILQQILLNITVYHEKANQEAILKLYKASIGLESDNNSEYCPIPKTPEERGKLIGATVEEILDYIPHQWRYKQDKINHFIEAVNKTIERITFQAGIPEFDKVGIAGINIKDDFNDKFLTYNYIKKITQSVIENDILNQEFPIYITHFKIEKLKPSPLQIQTNLLPLGVLNKEFEIEPNNSEIDNIFKGSNLDTHCAYKVIVSFNLRQENGEVKDFEVSSTGIGGQYSQINKVINRALLWDIKSIKDNYFPVAHDVIINQEIIGNQIGSPVWSHTLVQLCKLNTISEALLKHKTYREVSFLDEVGRGDYCTFNMMEAIGKSALQARLRAIKNTGINSQDYLQELSNKIDRVKYLKQSRKYLDFYPFSLYAMESHLTTKLLDKEENEIANSSNNQNLYSLCYYDAYLFVIYGFLNESLYRIAFKKLQKLDQILDFKSISALAIRFYSHQNIEEPKDFKIFSGSLLVRYELCQANYFYLLDCDDKEYKPDYVPNYQRSTYIQYSWEALERAEIHLRIRVAKYHIIGEIAQSIFHPHFLLLSNINFLRAKLFLFFPQESISNISEGNSPLKDYHYARLYYLEQARINAARDGETISYSYYTAYQSWAYLLAGYLINRQIAVGRDIQAKSVDFTKINCLNWARKLMIDALKNYAETGRKSYFQIKEKSGISGKNKYGNCQVVSLPLIREVNFSTCDLNKPDECCQGYYKGILYIDTSLLYIDKLDSEELEYEDRIYLFGSKAAMLLFTRGMYLLCSDTTDELNIHAKNAEYIHEWREKIKKAYRLFSFAWAIAEDGGKSIIEEDGFVIERPDFSDNRFKNTQEYHSPEVDSVRDLYPHRITEIADLGRVYAAVCDILLMYLGVENLHPQERREEYHKSPRQDIEDLVNKFYSINRCIPELVEHQPRFNGHLETYLNRVKKILNREIQAVGKRNTPIDNAKEISKIRDRIVQTLFDSFYSEPSDRIS